jgi:hypothetical protein
MFFAGAACDLGGQLPGMMIMIALWISVASASAGSDIWLSRRTLWWDRRR